MPGALSPRLAAIVDALPLEAGMRVLEIGCGPGAAAREVARRIGTGFVLAIDRSAKAIAQAAAAAAQEVATGRLEFRQVAIEEFERRPGEAPFDLAFAVRVGALDGRHPELQTCALSRIAAALRPGGRLFIDGGDPLRQLPLPSGPAAQADDLVVWARVQATRKEGTASTNDRDATPHRLRRLYGMPPKAETVLLRARDALADRLAELEAPEPSGSVLSLAAGDWFRQAELVAELLP